MTSTDQTETAQTAESVLAKPTKKATPGRRRANAAPKKAKSGKTTSPAKKAPTSAKKAAGAREVPRPRKSSTC